MTDLSTAVYLGVLEGLTEFIPVSSTGHLIILGDIIGFTGAKAESFQIFIQLGAILAVVLLYFNRFRDLFRFDSNDDSGFRGWTGIWKLGLGCLPAFVTGALFHSSIKEFLFFPFPVALALIVFGVIMAAVDRKDRKASMNSIEELSYKTCFLIGVFQCLALWPGTSRSGATIVGAMLLGCNRRVAAEFSFLLAVPVMCAAVGYDMLKSYAILSVDDIALFSVGFITSFAVAILAIKFFIEMLKKHTLFAFGIYRVVLGIAVLCFLPWDWNI